MKPELTPAAVAETELAVTDPMLAFVPGTMTVSPTYRDPGLEAAFRSTVADGPTVTFTRAPLAGHVEGRTLDLGDGAGGADGVVFALGRARRGGLATVTARSGRSSVFLPGYEYAVNSL